jgi:hypothetical protein
MKIKYLRESVFGKYKNKRSEEDKFKDLKKETARISNKWFQENIANKILEYYTPLMQDYAKRVSTEEGGIDIIFNYSNNQPVVDIQEITGKIIMRQYVCTPTIHEYSNHLFFTQDETFTIFDNIENYITEKFEQPCEIILVNCEIKHRFNLSGSITWYNDNDENEKIKEIPFLKYHDDNVKQIIFKLPHITSLTPIFKFFNRFESIISYIPSINLTNCNNLESFESEIPLESIKFGKIFLWNCFKLKSFNGWEKFMSKENPSVVYNINSFLNNTGQGSNKYEIISEFDYDPPVFELATKGKIQKRYILYLGELKKKQAEYFKRLLKRNNENPNSDFNDIIDDFDEEGANIRFLEYNLETGKVKQY